MFAEDRIIPLAFALVPAENEDGGGGFVSTWLKLSSVTYHLSMLS